MMCAGAEISRVLAASALGTAADGPPSAHVAGDFPGSAANGLIWVKRAKDRLLYILAIPDIMLTVGLTNEAETRRCAASPVSYCLDRTPSFLAGTTVTFKQDPESKVTGRTFHR
jgi:hypothetical protein